MPVPQALLADTNGRGLRLEPVPLLGNQADHIPLEVIQVPLSADRLRRLLSCNRRGRAIWGAHTVPNPTDRAKMGCKRHVFADADGLPLAVKTTTANTRDDQVCLHFVVAKPSIQGPRGQPRTKPTSLQDHAGYGCMVLAWLVKGLDITLLLKPLGKIAYMAADWERPITSLSALGLKPFDA